MTCWALGLVVLFTLPYCIWSRVVIKRLRYDELTGFYVRREFMDRARPVRTGSVVAILDLDELKELNDRLGHEAGDEFMREVASRIRNSGDQRKLVGRIGGDEFGIVLDGRASLLHLREELSRPLSVRGVAVTVACGATEAKPGVGFSELLRRADEEMYKDKRANKEGSSATTSRKAAS